MKKLVSLMLALVMVLATTVVSAGATEELNKTRHLVVSKEGGALVRTEPKQEAKEIVRLRKGEPIESPCALLNSRSNLWYKVYYNGSVGYIYSENVTAHEPNFAANGIVTDVCSCGYEKLHVSRHTQKFVSIVEGLGAFREPRASSECLRTYSRYERLDVVGRIRNEHNEVWLKLANGSYVDVTYTAFDFDASANEAYEYVKSRTFPAPPSMIVSVTPELLHQESWILAMLSAFKDNGEYDLKQASVSYPYTTLLGNAPVGNPYRYNIYSNGILQARGLTAVQLGNVQYGYVCAKFGVSQSRAVKYTGVDSEHPFRCMGNTGLCDNATGLNYTAMGYDIYNNRRGYGVHWDFDIRSPFINSDTVME